MSAVEYVVIAAAGLGSRLGLGKPKCLVEIDGYPIIAYQLELLKDIPNIRVVVGFEELDVMRVVRELRPDAVFVRNPSFRSTTTLASYAMGAEYVDKSCLFIDGDIIFQPDSFRSFVKSCSKKNPLVGVTEAKTEDAVYAHIENNSVIRFSRSENSKFEWANIVWVPPKYFSQEDRAVFERLEDDLPLPVCEVKSYEIDTAQDYEQASHHVYPLS